MSSSIDIKYSKECIIKNSLNLTSGGNIEHKYNYYLCVERMFYNWERECRNVELFVQQPITILIHRNRGELNIWNNILRVMDDRYDLMNMNNQYDYPPSYKQ